MGACWHCRTGRGGCGGATCQAGRGRAALWVRVVCQCHGDEVRGSWVAASSVVVFTRVWGFIAILSAAALGPVHWGDSMGHRRWPHRGLAGQAQGCRGCIPQPSPACSPPPPGMPAEGAGPLAAWLWEPHGAGSPMVMLLPQARGCPGVHAPLGSRSGSAGCAHGPCPAAGPGCALRSRCCSLAQLRIGWVSVLASPHSFGCFFGLLLFPPFFYFPFLFLFF